MRATNRRRTMLEEPLHRGASRRVRSLLVLCAVAALACQKPDPLEIRPRHVILVSIDTLRADRLGIYGYPRETSPHIDDFFGDKSIYRRTQSSAPCTIPSVFEFLNGVLMPGQRRLDRPGGSKAASPLEVEALRNRTTTTLAEILREQGFRTAAITVNGNFTQEQHGRGYETYVNLEHTASPEQRQGTMYEVTERALAWLDEHADESSLHLWVHYFGPHRPYFPPDSARRYSRSPVLDERLAPDLRKGATMAALRAASLAETGETVEAVRRKVPQLTGISKNAAWHLRGDIFSPPEVTHLRDSYDDDIRFVDQQFGRLLAKLDQLGLVEQSVIVLTSDHGEWLGEENVWHHCNSLHQRELHVPLLVSSNGRPLPAIDPSAVTSTLDILPTVLELLAIDAPHPLDGASLLEPKPDRAAIAFWGETFAVSDGRFKLYRGRFEALYDLESDPDETRNLIRSQPDTVDELTLALAEYLDDLPTLEEENRALRERLRSLGYL